MACVLLLGVAGSGVVAHSEEAPKAVAAAEQTGTTILEVFLNGESFGPTFLYRRGDRYYARTPDIERWRFKPIPLMPEIIDSEAYLPLDAFQGLAFKVDETRQVIEVTAPATLMESVTLDARGYSFVDSTQTAFGAFVNYNAVAQQFRARTNVSAFFEMGVSDHWGLVLNTLSAGNSIGPESVVRFDTSYIWDSPRNVTRFTAGDAIAPGGAAGRFLRYAGVGYGTDFGLQPELTTFPTPFFEGQAALPSTVQIYVNDVLNYTRSIDRGPFTINRIPVMTGSGNLRLVMRDALGVERIFNLPYYAGSSNLRAGLSEYYFAAGAIRENYGFESFDYGAAFATGTYGYGFTDSLTMEAHAEAEDRAQMGSLSASWIIPNIGEVSGTVAGSMGDQGNGSLWGVGFQRDDIYWNIFGNYQVASHRFNQVGVRNPADQVELQAQAGAGLSLGRLGNVSASYGKVDYRSGLKTDVVTVSHSVQIGARLQLSTFALISNATGAKTSTSIGIGFTVPLGDRAAASARSDYQNGRLVGTAEYRLNPPTDEGFGYSVTGSGGATNYGSADVTWRNRYNALRAQVDYRGGSVSGMFEAIGSIGLVEGHPFFAREIDDAYGIVLLPGHDDVTVYQENRPVARTKGGEGVAVLPSLNSYQSNKVSVDSEKLPISTQLSVGSVNVVPRYRGAVVVNYPIKNVRSGSVTVLRPDGQPVAAGSRVRVAGANASTFAGFRGEVFLEQLNDNMTLSVEDAAGACSARVGVIPTDQELPQLPPITCEPGS